MFREYAPIGLLVFALITAVFSCFGADSLSRLYALRSSVQSQQAQNVELRERIGRLRKQVRALREDTRELEKAARNELGLAHPDEEIYIFDRKSKAS